MGQLSPPDSRYFLILTNKTCKIASKSGFCPLLESDDVVLTCLPPIGKFSADAHGNRRMSSHVMFLISLVRNNIFLMFPTCMESVC